MSDQRRGAVRTTAPRGIDAAGPREERAGVRRSGRIVRLLIGQAHGFIRMANDREVFFHRSDVRAGTSFNRLSVGDTVSFELLDDQVSGPRALHVEAPKVRE